MLWLLTVATAGVLLLIAGFVRELARTPAEARPAALTATAHSTRHAARPPPPSASVRVRDASSGLSYRLLSSPWRRGCPGVLDTPVFSWTAGEHAIAGQVDLGGTMFDWHGNACSGRLGPQFAYSGPAGLEPAARSVADAVGPAYYSGLQHDRTIESSSAIQVSGHQAWVITFLMTYPDAASEGLAWTSETGAVVIVDRGPGRAPAVFYASVPSNLGASDVAILVGSLQLSPG